VLAASQGAVSGARAGGSKRSHSGSQAARTATGVEAPPPDAFGRGDFEVGQVWTAALELTIATHGAEPYKSRLGELFPQMIPPQQMDLHGWTAVRALPHLDASAKDQLREAVKTYMATETARSMVHQHSDSRTKRGKQLPKPRAGATRLA
jgi:endoglucanase